MQLHEGLGLRIRLLRIDYAVALCGSTITADDAMAHGIGTTIRL